MKPNVMPGNAAFYTQTTKNRMLDMLESSLGPDIWKSLDDPLVTEVRVNSDGSIWLDKIGSGDVRLDTTMTPDKAYSVLMIVADAKGEQIGDENPSFDAVIPGYGYRFAGTLPPLTAAPAFNIRKKPGRVITLDEYVASGIMTERQKAALIEAVKNRETVLVGGGTGSGKTTLLNAVLQVMAATGDRILTVEDTLELMNSARDQESFLTVPGVRTMEDCLRIALRFHPKRLVFGEARGAEVRAMMMAMNSGHPGGALTLHSDSNRDSLYRIEEMLETIPNYQPRPKTIARVMRCLVYISTTHDRVRYPAGRYVSEIAKVHGWTSEEGYQLEVVG